MRFIVSTPSCVSKTFSESVSSIISSSHSSVVERRTSRSHTRARISE